MVLVAVAVVFAIAAVFAAVLGLVVADPTAVTVANSLAGSDFANDVAGLQAADAIQALINAIDSGNVPLPDNLNADDVISSLKNVLQNQEFIQS